MTLARLASASEAGSEGQDAPEPVASRAGKPPASGWLPGAALHTPLSLGILSEDDIDQAALLLTGLDLDVSLGRRIGQSSRLAWELGAGMRHTLGVVHRYPLDRFDPELPGSFGGWLSYVLPLGLCIDWMPASRAGWFGSVHGGVGTFSRPDFMSSGNIALAGRLAVDLGWMMPLESGSLALTARYSMLGLKRVYIDEEYNSALQLHELSFGVAWNL